MSLSDLLHDESKEWEKSEKSLGMEPSKSKLLMTAADRIDELERQVAQYKEDAERYRVLREQNSVFLPKICDPFKDDISYTPIGLDATIDAVRRKKTK